MPRRSGEDRPLRAVRGRRRDPRQPRVGLSAHTRIAGAVLPGRGDMQGAGAGAMADPAIEIELASALPVLVGGIGRALGLMLMLMMTDVLHLGRNAFMHAISRHRRPTELEREQGKHQNSDQAAHFWSLACALERFLRGSATFIAGAQTPAPPATWAHIPRSSCTPHPPRPLASPPARCMRHRQRVGSWKAAPRMK